LARFNVDFHDGMGLRDGSAKVGLLDSYGPTFALSVSMSNVPVQYGNAASWTGL